MPFFECRRGMWKRLGSGSSNPCEISGAQPVLGVIIKTFYRLLDPKMVTKIGLGKTTNKESVSGNDFG